MRFGGLGLTWVQSGERLCKATAHSEVRVSMDFSLFPGSRLLRPRFRSRRRLDGALGIGGMLGMSRRI